MYYPDAYVRRSTLGTGVTGLTGAAPQTGAGKAMAVNEVLDGTLSARVYVKAGTTSLAITFKWQVLDDDGVTWIDVCESNNPANVVLVTASATKTVIIAAPAAVYARRQVRGVVVTAAATAAGLGTDEFSIAYDYRLPSIF